MKSALLIGLLAIGCGAPDETLPKHVTLLFAASPACGLSPGLLRVNTHERAQHGRCILTTHWEGDSLLIEDTCPTPQRLSCEGRLGEAGKCEWTEDGATWCAFDMTIHPND